MKSLIILQRIQNSRRCEKRMMDAYNRAKASYEDKINRAYYFDFSNPHCRQFYKDTFTAAGKRGVQMTKTGIRSLVNRIVVLR